MDEERIRTGGQILAEHLRLHTSDHIFCVPGESYLAVLDALHEAEIQIADCRHEGGAAIMAEARGKLSGRRGICSATRSPGVSNVCPDNHIAKQDPTPLIVFFGQVAREVKGWDGLQEADDAAVFGTLAKWPVETDDPGEGAGDRLSHVSCRDQRPPGPGGWSRFPRTY